MNFPIVLCCAFSVNPICRNLSNTKFTSCITRRGNLGWTKCRLYPISALHTAPCEVWCVVLPPQDRLGGNASFLFQNSSYVTQKEGLSGFETLTPCASILFSRCPMLLYAELNLLWLELMETKEQRQFTSCKPRSPGNHPPWPSWRDLHYLVLLLPPPPHSHWSLKARKAAVSQTGSWLCTAWFYSLIVAWESPFSPCRP